jgi:hypothetical protein
LFSNKYCATRVILKKVDWLNHTYIDENYDLTKPNGEEKDIKFICNLFIHSYVFVVSGDGKLEGVYVVL